MTINTAFVIAPQNMFGEFNLSCRDIQSKDLCCSLRGGDAVLIYSADWGLRRVQRALPANECNTHIMKLTFMHTVVRIFVDHWGR
jgi:hypothetical protein